MLKQGFMIMRVRSLWFAGAVALGSVSVLWTGCSASRFTADSVAVARVDKDPGSVETTEDAQPVEVAGAQTLRLESQGERCEWLVQDLSLIHI